VTSTDDPRPEVVRCPVCRHPAHFGQRCSAVVSAAVSEQAPGLGRVTTIDSRRCCCTRGQEADKPC
jgi:hypothetical protein